MLEALPGKKPLIKRSFRPPNYETPVAVISTSLHPQRRLLRPLPRGRSGFALADGACASAGPSTKTPPSSRSLSWTELRAAEVAAVNQCSGNRRGLFEPHVPGIQWGYGGMGNARWRGVRLKDVLEGRRRRKAVEVAGDGADTAMLPGPDFVKSLPMWKALDEDTLIAFEMNGEPLPHWHGYPARLVVPGWTATYWVKHLTPTTWWRSRLTASG